MLKLDEIDETISKYYDREMNISELTAFEARLADSQYAKQYVLDRCFEHHRISSSIKQVKYNLEKHCNLLTDEILNKNREKLFFNFNPVILKSLYKKLCRLSLNILRNNAK